MAFTTQTFRPGQIEFVEGHNFAIATLHGEMVYNNVEWWLPPLTDALCERNAHLVVDLSDIEDIDSGALGNLVALVAEGHTRACRVIFVGLAPYIVGVLEVTNLDRFFEVCANVDEATARLSAS
jgi:anti-anti-sigma factor